MEGEEEVWSRVRVGLAIFNELLLPRGVVGVPKEESMESQINSYRKMGRDFSTKTRSLLWEDPPSFMRAGLLRVLLASG